MEKLPKCEGIEEVDRYLEAMYYEQKMRLRLKNELMDQVKASVSKKEEEKKNVTNLIKRMKYEINLFKKLNEVKNLRHAGLYKDEKISVDNINSEIYDWIVDIDLISNVIIIFNLDFKIRLGSKI